MRLVRSVTREAGVGKDRPNVASVIDRRLGSMQAHGGDFRGDRNGKSKRFHLFYLAVEHSCKTAQKVVRDVGEQGTRRPENYFVAASVLL